MYYATAILQNDLRSVSSMETQPLNIVNISMEKTRELVPETLKSFLYMLVQPEKQFTEQETFCQRHSETERKVLSIAQDIVSLTSGGRKKKPKNVGLSLAIKKNGERKRNQNNA